MPCMERLSRPLAAGVCLRDSERSSRIRDGTNSPLFAPDLDFAEASVSTVRGKISVRWERVSEAGIRMRLELPCTMSATAALASPSTRPITGLLIDGVEIWGGAASSCMPDGIVRCELDDSMLELELLSGRYELTVRY